MAIRTLIAKFIADTTQFEAGVKKAEKALTPFQQRMVDIKNVSKTLSLFRGAGVFAGVTGAALALDRVLTKVNANILDIHRGLKTTGEAMRDVVRELPVVGSLGQNIRMAVLPSGRTEVKELVALENQIAAAETVTRDLEVKIAEASKRAAERAEGRAKLAAMVALGREQADERAREAFEFSSKFGRENFDRLLSMGRDQLEEVKQSAIAITERFRDPVIKLREQIDEVTQAWKRGFIEAGSYMNTVEGLRKEIESIIESEKKRPAVLDRPATSDFREISLSRTAIGGLSSAGNSQQVMDPQLKETNRILRNIERNRSGTVFAP